MFLQVGVWIGYGLFRGFAWGYTTLIQQLAVQPRGLPAYLYQVARQEPDAGIVQKQAG